MGVLGTVILVFIVLHMSGFWYQYKFGEVPYMMSETGEPIAKTGEVIVGGVIQQGEVMLNEASVGPAMKDLHHIVLEAFKEWYIVLIYVLAMIAIAFHLWHGFSSAFQSVGVNHKAYTPVIKKLGYGFAIVIPGLFAIIPVSYTHLRAHET